MPNVLRTGIERTFRTSAYGLGGFLLIRAASGYLDRREKRLDREDLHRHLVEMALEKEAELSIPENSGEAAHQFTDWDPDEVLDTDLIHEGRRGR